MSKEKRRVEMLLVILTESDGMVVVNFMCQLVGAKGCPDSW